MENQKKNGEISRRKMLKGLGIGLAGGALTLSGSGKVFGMESDRTTEPESKSFVPEGKETMKIVKVESIRFSDKIVIGGGSGGDGKAEFCWVRIYTNNGITGLAKLILQSTGSLEV